MKFIYVLAASIFSLSYGVCASDRITVPLSAVVTDSTCAAANNTATLPDIYVQDFGGKAGKELSSVPVTVSITCSTALTNVTFRTEGVADPDLNNSKTFKNTLTGSAAATGVGINLYFETLYLSTDKAKRSLSAFPKGAKTFPLILTAKYVSTRDVITPGKVAAMATIYFQYN
jgi:type 1 fimbria pilin